jgi:hyperosmotically inducible periplasmic protein
LEINMASVEASVMTPFITPVDHELARRIQDSLRHESSLNNETIAVDVRGGHAILRGTVSSYAAKMAACSSARCVDGLVSVDDELSVHLPASARCADAALRDAAVDAIKWKACLPRGSVEVSIRGGAVTLTGRVDWSYQKRLAEAVIVPLQGVTRIINKLRVSDRQVQMEVLTQIRAALRIAAERHAGAIDVQAKDGMVTLRGRLPTAAERAMACEAARSHPEVRELRVEIDVPLQG